jgi:hypothetical protein
VSHREIDRHSVIQQAAHARRGHRPAVCAAIFIEPGRDVRVPLTEPAGWNADPDPDGKAVLGYGDHLARVTWHVEVPYLFLY